MCYLKDSPINITCNQQLKENKLKRNISNRAQRTNTLSFNTSHKRQTYILYNTMYKNKFI